MFLEFGGWFIKTTNKFVYRKENPLINSNSSPLVTFALFAYNQEKYIKEAIEGALSQTYSPLEIIISDDCSTDKTFEIAEQVTSGYKGPHQVRLNRNNINKGFGSHIKTIAAKAAGQIVIMAAGDDFSHADRSQIVVNTFLANSSIYAVFTDVRTIDEDGNILNQHLSRWNVASDINIPVLVRNGGGVGTGASYAYHRDCFQWPWDFPDFVISEDRLLPLRAACLGKLKYVPQALVSYRISKNSLSAILANTGQLAMMSTIHLNELSKTIGIAVDQKRISFCEAKVALRIINELPLYFRFLEKTRSKQFIFKRSIVRIVENWFHRESIWLRFIKKIS